MPLTEEDEEQQKIYKLFRESKSPHALKSMPRLKAFKQGQIIRAYTSVLSSGVCNGLCIEYARHVMHARSKQQEGDFIEKLEKKLADLSNMRFAERVALYQQLQSSNARSSGCYTLNHHAIGRDGLLTHLPAAFQEKEIININLRPVENIAGHAIAIRLVRDKDSKEVTGYKLYDPNFGEFSFTDDTPEQNKKNFERYFKALRQEEYPKLSYMDAYDLGSIVERENLLDEKQLNKRTVQMQVFGPTVAVLATGAALTIKIIMDAYYKNSAIATILPIIATSAFVKATIELTDPSVRSLITSNLIDLKEMGKEALAKGYIGPIPVPGFVQYFSGKTAETTQHSQQKADVSPGKEEKASQLPLSFSVLAKDANPDKSTDRIITTELGKAENTVSRESALGALKTPFSSTSSPTKDDISR